MQETYAQIYQQLLLDANENAESKTVTAELKEPEQHQDQVQNILHLIHSQLNEQQQQELLQALTPPGDQNTTQAL